MMGGRKSGVFGVDEKSKGRVCISNVSNEIARHISIRKALPL